MAGIEVGSHWIHERFVNNLLNASHSRDLAIAAMEWRHEGIFDSQWFSRINNLSAKPEELRCQFCNTRIKNYVVLANSTNGNRLLIGHDCYDKLLLMLLSGKVESALPDRKAYLKQVKTYWKEAVYDRTFLGWFNQRLSAGDLPAPIADLYALVLRLGYAPTTSQADELVTYYKNTRRFRPAVLLGKDFQSFPHHTLVVKDISIQESHRLKRLMEKYKRHQNKIRADRVVDQEWSFFRSEVFRQTSAIKASIEAAQTRGLDYDQNQAQEFLAIAEKIFCLPEQRPANFPSSLVRQEFIKTLEAWRQWAQPLAAAQVPAVLLLPEPNQHPPYQARKFLIRENHRWKEYRTNNIGNEQVLQEPGPAMYLVRKFFQNSQERIIVDSPFTADFPVVDFSIKSKYHAGEFVGKHSDKIVLPHRRILEPGLFRVFLMKDQGSYYQAWVLDKVTTK